jgi:hypothetical protein
MPQLQKGGLAPATNVTVVPVYFNGETLQSMLDAAIGKWIASSYFTASLTEYGVKSGTMGTSTPLMEDALATPTIDDVETWLKGKLDGTHAEFGAVDAVTLRSKIFVLYYPSSTTITFGTLKSCTDFGGAHFGVTLTGGAVANYVVLPRCTPTGTLTQLDELTATATAMITSSATNPIQTQSGSMQGYAGFDQAHAAFNFVASEVGTACQTEKPVTPMDLGVAISRTWSNAAAAAYHEPCLPAPDTQPFFTAAAVLPDDVTMPMGGTIRGVKVPKGGSAKISLELLSDAPTSAPWTVQANSPEAGYSFTVAPASGSNGDVMELTITDTGASAPSMFVVSSGLNKRHTFWVGYAGPN